MASYFKGVETNGVVEFGLEQENLTPTVICGANGEPGAQNFFRFFRIINKFNVFNNFRF